MIDCKKRQNEVYKGTPQTRCINKKSDSYLEIVDGRACEACPVRQGKNRKGPCKEIPIPIIQKTALDRHEGYPPCPFRYEGDSGLKCSITGLYVTTDICDRCEAETGEHEATFGEKVKNYFGAVRRWVASGRPTRSDKEIEILFQEHCGNGCKRYDKEKHACKNCGCAVSDSATPLKNKLAMASEHCPLGRF